MDAELLDILDDRGVLTGRTAPRAEAHARGLWHRTVHVWVTTPDRRILLQKRAPQKETFPGMWDISAAGHVAAGDQPLDAAVRETHEELGLVLAPEDLRLLGTFPASYDRPDGRFFDREFVHVYAAIVAVDLADLRLQPGEVAAAAFFTWPELSAALGEHPDSFVPHVEEYRMLERAWGSGDGLFLLS